jgi:hypothetical protein
LADCIRSTREDAPRASSPIRLLLLLLCALLLPTVARAQLDVDTALKVAKLEVKLAKRQVKLAAHQLALADAQVALLAAQLALLDAEALPELTLEELLAKTKAVKLANKAIKKFTGKTAKLNAKIAKCNLAIANLMAKIEELDPGHFDDGDPGGGDPGGGDPGGGDPQGGLDPAASMALLAVDCGDLNGYAAVQEGWQLLSQSGAPAGVSLSPAPLDTVHVATWFPGAGKVAFPSSVATIDPDQLGEARLFTSLKLASPTTLTLSGLPPNTSFRVQLELGALAPWIESVSGQWTAIEATAPDIDVDAWLNGGWQSALRDMRCTTGLMGSTWSTDLGGVVRAFVPARSDGSGVLRLRFSSSSGGDVFLAAFALYNHEALPIFYKRTGAGALQTTNPAAVFFVSAFNADDMEAAEEAADAISDDWLRGVALMHLIGWLDGTRDGRVGRLDDAIAALVSARDEGHPAAVWLLSDALGFRRALAHIEAGNSDASLLCPDQGGPGFLNPDCAGQIYTLIGQSHGNVNVHIAQRLLQGMLGSPSGQTPLVDLAAFNAGTLTADRWEPSPLLPRALKQWGVNLTLMNPQLSVALSDPESVGMLQDLRDVFEDFETLGFAAADFPDEHELHLFRAYADAGKHPKDWEPEDYPVFTASQIAASWWGDDVAVPSDTPGVQTWANAQRSFVRVYRNAVKYWLAERLQGGEFGGGHGDDVELLLQLFPLLQMRYEARDRRLAAGLDEALVWGLDDHPVIAPGYYDGKLTDVEHTAEYTTDPFLAARSVFGLTARAARTAFYNAHEVLDTADPDSAWAAVNSLGRTRFRSYWFTATGPSDDVDNALDTFLNGRAVSPAVALAGRGTLAPNHPALADLRAWAAGWRDDALVSAGKPEGFPAPAQWPSGALGEGSTWYAESGTPGDASLWTLGQVSYVLGLLQGAYRGSADVERWQFLLPAVRMFRAAKAWEDAGQPAGAAGGLWWVAQKFRQGSRFGPLAASLYADLAGDATLNGTPDPANPGTTYVDAALLARLLQWVDIDGNDQGSALAYAVGAVSACSEHLTKPTGALPTVYQNGTLYYRNVYPLITARVLHTDRVFLGPSKVLRDLQAAWTGDISLEGLPPRPLVRWAGDGLDLSVSCNYRDLTGGGWSAFVHNFAGQAKPVTLILEEGLLPGEYLLEAGAASANCDLFPSAPSLSLPVTKRGVVAQVSFDLVPGLNLVRLTRTGAALPPAGWDLCADAPLLQSEPNGDYTVRVRVVNLGSSSAPSATLQLHVAAVNQDGTLAAPAVLPEELLLSSAPVNLGAVSGWNLPETTKLFSIPADSAVGNLLQQGYGLQLRALVSTTAAEGDAFNNDQARCWFLAEIPAAP